MKVIKHETSWGRDDYKVIDVDTDILSCFCGGSPIIYEPYLYDEQSGSWGKSYFACEIMCNSCKNKSKRFTDLNHRYGIKDFREQAVKDWNTRARFKKREVQNGNNE